ncbi:MAG: hypothetical protein IT469_01620 [Pseudomonadales bacterium]|nr:hypothetical protein [Pseudomonadales bacterium]
MSSTTVAANCHPSVWKRINAITDKRDAAKTREGDLVKHRKEVEGELAECGATPSTRRTKLCVDHWDTICSIEHERTRIRTLADLMDTTVKEGRQGKLFEKDDLEAEIEQAGDEPEPELVRSAREDREEREGKGAAATADKGFTNELGQVLEVDKAYRFTARTNVDRWMEGVVNRIGGKGAVEVSATRVSPGNGQPGARNVNLGAVAWVRLEPEAQADAQPEAAGSNGIAEVAADLGWKFPGAFAFRPQRSGAPVTRHEFGDMEAMLTKLAQVCGLEATPEKVRLGMGGSVMVRQPDTDKAIDCWESVGSVSQVESDAEARGGGDAPHTDPASQVEAKPKGKKNTKPLEEVRDGNGRPRKRKAAAK